MFFKIRFVSMQIFWSLHILKIKLHMWFKLMPIGEGENYRSTKWRHIALIFLVNIFQWQIQNSFGVRNPVLQQSIVERRARKKFTYSCLTLFKITSIAFGKSHHTWDPSNHLEFPNVTRNEFCRGYSRKSSPAWQWSNQTGMITHKYSL